MNKLERLLTILAKLDIETQEDIIDDIICYLSSRGIEVPEESTDEEDK